MNLTIMRPFNGIGDWLFALACVKFVNLQRPDVAVHVNFARVRPSKLPAIVPGLFALSDTRYVEGAGPPDGLVTYDSLVYRKRPPELFLESTVQHLNDQTGIGLKYEHGVYPSFGVRPESRGYIAMIGHGKNRVQAGKEWGFENFSALAALLLDSGFEVVQVGAENDWRLPRANAHVMGAGAEEVLKVLAGARLYVGIENGLMVLGGYLGIPQVTIYNGHGYPTRVDFEGQTKLAEQMTPGAVADTVKGLLC